MHSGGRYTNLVPCAASPPQAKKYDRAIAILARNAWWDKLIHVVRAVEKTDSRCLGMCAGHFRRAAQYQYAKVGGVRRESESRRTPASS